MARTSEDEELIRHFEALINDLHDVGFGTDDEICGSDLVEFIGRHWDESMYGHPPLSEVFKALKEKRDGRPE